MLFKILTGVFLVLGALVLMTGMAMVGLAFLVMGFIGSAVLYFDKRNP